jgi:hypothetical protein
MFGEVSFRQTTVVPFIVAIGEGRTITEVDAEADGPLHPLAMTLMVA